MSLRLSRLSFLLAAVTTLTVSGFCFAEEASRGILPDGRAFRRDADGIEVIDYIAELEVENDALKRKIQGVEDEVTALRQQRAAGVTGGRLTERSLVGDSGVTQPPRPQFAPAAALAAPECPACEVCDTCETCPAAPAVSPIEADCSSEKAQLVALKQKLSSTEHMLLSRGEKASTSERLLAERTAEIERISAALISERTGNGRKIAALEQELATRNREVALEKARYTTLKQNAETERAALESAVRKAEQSVEKVSADSRVARTNGVVPAFAPNALEGGASVSGAKSDAAVAQGRESAGRGAGVKAAKNSAGESARDAETTANENGLSRGLGSSGADQRIPESPATRAALAPSSPARSSALELARSEIAGEVARLKNAINNRETLFKQYSSAPRAVQIKPAATRSSRGRSVEQLGDAVVAAANFRELAATKAELREIALRVNDDTALLQRMLKSSR